MVLTIDLIEESFVAAAPATVAATLRDEARWPRWWPDLTLTVFQDRGPAGVRWNVTGALVGSMEVWLQPHGDGVIVHHYLRAEPGPGRARSARACRRDRTRRARHAKRLFWTLKDEWEGDRAPGEPARGEGG